jgi:pyrroline-5-carboxylate reductase
MAETIGCIGVGRIATAVVEALVTGPGAAPHILLSPRNAERAAGLAARFPTVDMAESNQAVIDDSRTIILALRPPAVAEVLRPLRFDGGQTVLSLIPVPIATLVPLVAPARQVVRALVLPTCVERRQIVPHWPGHAGLLELLARLGPPVPVREEQTLNVLWASTAVISSFYAWLDAVAGWAAGQGVPPDIAADYTARTAHGLLGAALAGGPDRFARLAAEASTPGGLNEHVLGVLRTGGAYAHLSSALDAVLARILRGPEA